MGPLGDTRAGLPYVLLCPEQPLFVPDVPSAIINIPFYSEKCLSRHCTPGSIGSAAIPVCHEHVDNPEPITEPLGDLAGQSEIWTRESLECL